MPNKAYQGLYQYKVVLWDKVSLQCEIWKGNCLIMFFDVSPQVSLSLRGFRFDLTN